MKTLNKSLKIISKKKQKSGSYKITNLVQQYDLILKKIEKEEKKSNPDLNKIKEMKEGKKNTADLIEYIGAVEGKKRGEEVTVKVSKWFGRNPYVSNKFLEVDDDDIKYYDELKKGGLTIDNIHKYSKYDILNFGKTFENKKLKSEIDELQKKTDTAIADLEKEKKEINLKNTQLSLKDSEISILTSKNQELTILSQQKGLLPISWNQRIGQFFNFNLNNDMKIDFQEEKQRKENIIRGVAILGITSTMGLLLYKVTKKIFKSTFNQDQSKSIKKSDINNLLLEFEKPEKPPKKTTSNYLDNLQSELSQMYIDNQIELFLFSIVLTLFYSLFYTRKPSLIKSIYNTILYGVVPNLFLLLYSHSTLQKEQQNQQLFDQIEQNYHKDYQKYQNIFQQLRYSSLEDDNNIHSGGKKTIPLINICQKLLGIVNLHRPKLIIKYNAIIDKIILRIKTKKLKFSYIKIFIEKYLCILLTLAIYLILFKTNIFQKIKDQFFKVYKHKVITQVSSIFSKTTKLVKNKKKKNLTKKQNQKK